MPKLYLLSPAVWKIYGGPNDPPPPLGLICYSRYLGRPRVIKTKGLEQSTVENHGKEVGSIGGGGGEGQL